MHAPSVFPTSVIGQHNSLVFRTHTWTSRSRLSTIPVLPRLHCSISCFCLDAFGTASVSNRLHQLQEDCGLLLLLRVRSLLLLLVHRLEHLLLRCHDPNQLMDKCSPDMEHRNYTRLR